MGVNVEAYCNEAGNILLSDLAPLTVAEYRIMAEAADEIYRQRLIDQGGDPVTVDAIISVIDDYQALEALSGRRKP